MTCCKFHKVSSLHTTTINLSQLRFPYALCQLNLISFTRWRSVACLRNVQFAHLQKLLKLFDVDPDRSFSPLNLVALKRAV